MKRNRLISIAVAAVISFGCLLTPYAAFGIDITDGRITDSTETDNNETSGMCGNQLRWNFDSEGTLTISGEGEMYPFGTDLAPWANLEVKKVVLESGVTYIATNVFYDCYMVTSIDIPDSVTEIDMYAFRGCTSLTEINFPEHLNYICWNAFEDTPWYKNNTDDMIIVDNILMRYKGTETDVVIPDTVDEIADYAFKDCTSLSSISIPDSVVEIGRSAFQKCTSLKSISVPEKIVSIGDYAFEDCSSLSEISIPDGILKIGIDAFSGTPWYTKCDDMIIIGGIFYQYKGINPDLQTGHRHGIIIAKTKDVPNHVKEGEIEQK